MALPDPNQVLTILTVAGESGVLLLAVIRRLWRRLPLFTVYLMCVVAADFARIFVLVSAGGHSPAYAWTYWRTQELLLLARAGALVDICRAALGCYLGVWRLARYLLVAGACFMLALANARSIGTAGITSYFVFVERELEVAVVVILLLLLAVSHYYGVTLQRPLAGIIFGLAFYSSVVIIISSILIGALNLSWPLISAVRVLAYALALASWAYALRLPLEEPERLPLTAAGEFELASEAVDQRMRELNAKLLQLMKR